MRGATDLELSWQRCGDEWYLLESCEPPLHATGVYVIWEPLLFVRERRVVYVGEGPVLARLACHRDAEDILYYGKGRLLVTWANCPSGSTEGVVRYLAGRYRPYEGQPGPGVEPVSMNLPI